MSAPKAAATCMVKDCPLKAKTKGRCSAHYEHWRRYKTDIGGPPREWSRQDGQCADCGSDDQYAKSRCRSCYRKRKYQRNKRASVRLI